MWTVRNSRYQTPPALNFQNYWKLFLKKILFSCDQEYQKQRAKVEEELVEKDRQRLQFQKQLLDDSDTDNRFIENGSPYARQRNKDDVINDTPRKY